jgi:hypothetical protein
MPEERAMSRPIVVLSVAIVCFCLVAPFSFAAEKVIEPFNGKNLDGWVLKGDPNKSVWTVGIAKMSEDNPRELVVTPADGTGELVNAGGHGLDMFSEAEFGDCLLTIEVMVPQGSNSGIYLMGNYEIQVLDSFGKEKVGPGDIGGLYGAAAPKVNAAKAPGEWQKFEIDFSAPKYDGDTKTANAKFNKITLNGQVIHENVELAQQTGGSLGRGEGPVGPLMFQGNHGAVAYRNIKIVSK